MGLTRCYKTAVFFTSTCIFAVFLPQTIAEIQVLPVLKANGPILELYFGFQFWPHYSQQRVMLRQISDALLLRKS